MVRTDSELCMRCGHDREEHQGACGSDLFAGRTWTKCPCFGYVESSE